MNRQIKNSLEKLWDSAHHTGVMDGIGAAIKRLAEAGYNRENRNNPDVYDTLLTLMDEHKLNKGNQK